MKGFKFILLSTLVFAAACTGLGTVQPESDLSEVVLKLDEAVAVQPGGIVEVEIVSTVKPAISDQIVLRSNVKGSHDFVIPISSIDGNILKFQIPAVFDYDSYNFCLRRAKALKGYGLVQFVLVKDDELELKEDTNVYGIVSCQGKPLPGVVVSDGYEVVATDENGLYQINSKKANAYVFISVPSGYEVESWGVMPQLHKHLYASAEKLERRDFSLYDAGDQTNHTMLYFGDIHLANRTNDRSQFIRFLNDVNNYKDAHSGDKIYAMTLGDMTWDLYWYENNYCFAQYLADMGNIKNLQVFHTIGNHDHDMNETGDWKTVLRYKEDMVPNYYSFNIGNVHYVVIDDIECTNTADKRQYNSKIVDDDLKWLKKDLEYVDNATTSLVVTMHAPLYNYKGIASLTNLAAFKDIVKDFDVTVVTGHTHDVYNNSNDGIVEMNNGAVCGAWWWAGKYYPTFNIGQDGSPNGYRVVENKGTTYTSYFKTIGRDASYQFRTYDRNCICVDAAAFDITDPVKEVGLAKEVAKDSRYGNYGVASDENIVLINVWDWNADWTIEVTENGNALEVEQKELMDPAFYLAYVVPRVMENKDGTVTWHLNPSMHMFQVKASAPDTTLEITVTDDEGRVYKESMARPKKFIIENYK